MINDSLLDSAGLWFHYRLYLCETFNISPKMFEIRSNMLLDLFLAYLIINSRVNGRINIHRVQTSIKLQPLLPKFIFGKNIASHIAMTVNNSFKQL